MKTPHSLPARQLIRDKALGLGFDHVRIARPRLSAQTSQRLQVFLERGWHGDMDWLARNKDRRKDPRCLLPRARSVIVCGLNYAPTHDPLASLRNSDKGVISVYAQAQDYHTTITKNLKALARWLVQDYGGDARVFVDTAPLMEKPIAQQAGMGWQGKHTNVVSRDYGSWLLLGEVITTLDVQADAAENDHCGSCRSCIDICPTQAIVAPYQLDARLCISYLTIEHKGVIPRALRHKMGNRIYGCDDCLAVCPWNKFARSARHWQSQTIDVPLIDLAALDDSAFRTLFRGTAIKRTGRNRFVRNVLIAIGNMGNSGDKRAIDVVRARLNDTSPLVRGMAVWALSRLAPHNVIDQCYQRYGRDEQDSDVRAEWQAVYAGASSQP